MSEYSDHSLDNQVSKWRDDFYMVQARMIEHSEALERWRGWAQFVFLGGRPRREGDDALRAAVCAGYDELRGELARLRQQQVRWADNIRSALNVEPTLAQPISVEYLIGILVALETELRG